jgi:hypothetical protein
MYWSVIATLQYYYIRRVNSQSIRATEREGVPTLKKFWNALNNTGNSLAEIK